MTEQLVNTSGKKYVIEAALGAAQAALLFVPITFLADIISWIDDRLICTLLVIILSASFYGTALVSASKRQFMLKWLLSVPVTIVLWHYFIQTNFSIRSLNWIFPGYGSPSAGGKFASTFLLFLQFGCCFITWGIALAFSRVKGRKCQNCIEILQKAVCSIICIGIVITVVVLESVFPPYASLSLWG